MPVYRINNKTVLFIHVPKTGGTSVDAWLSAQASVNLHNRLRRLFSVHDGLGLDWQLPMQHFHAEVLERMFAPGFFDYAFMVVRDPLERLKSEYRHIRALPLRVDTWLPFGVWARLMLWLARQAPSFARNHLRPQSDFVCFNAEVFRFEDGVEHIVTTLAERLGLPRPQDIPHERNLADEDIPVSPRTARALRTAYARDYEAFGYDMTPAGDAPSAVVQTS